MTYARMLAVVLAVGFGNGAITSHAVAKCGKERWDVKSLSDSRAAEIDKRSKHRTIAALLELQEVVPGVHEPRRDDELRRL